MTYNLFIELVKRCGSQGLKVKAHQRRGDAAAEVTPVRCKTKQNAQARSFGCGKTRPAERSGWLLPLPGTGVVTSEAIQAAEK